MYSPLFGSNGVILIKPKIKILPLVPIGYSPSKWLKPIIIK